MGVLTLDDLSSITESLPLETITVPEWPSKDGTPGLIQMRPLTAGEHLDMMEASEKSGGKDWIFLCLVYSIVHEDGSRILSVDHVPMLKTKSIVTINRLHRIYLRLNAARKEDDDARKKS